MKTPYAILIGLALIAAALSSSGSSCKPMVMALTA